MLRILFYLQCGIGLPYSVEVAETDAGCTCVPALEDTLISLSGFLSVTEYQRQLQASVVYLRLYPEADHAEGLVKDYRIVIPEVDASMSEQYLHLFVLMVFIVSFSEFASILT